MPIVDELVEVAVKHGAGKKSDYASDMTIADVFRRFAEKMSEGSEGSGGGDSGWSGGGVLLVKSSNGTLDRTWQEIHDAALIGAVSLLFVSDDQTEVSQAPFQMTLINGNEYQVEFGFGDSSIEVYIALSANGYPVLSDS